MAKARKLTISRSERFLGTIYNYSTQNHESEPDLGEEDVWPTVDEIVNDDDDDDESTDESHGSGSMRIRRRNSGQEEGHVAVGGLSLAFEDGDLGGGKISATSRILHHYRFHDPPRGRQMATSAPVNVPNWGSRITRVESVESLPDSNNGVDDNNDNQKMVPPHVYLAREYGCSRNSVFEGVGRTLKGRDLSRVRDAVWSQTGFDG